MSDTMTRKEWEGDHCINSGCIILDSPGKLKQQDEETDREREGGRQRWEVEGGKEMDWFEGIGSDDHGGTSPRFAG